MHPQSFGFVPLPGSPRSATHAAFTVHLNRRLVQPSASRGDPRLQSVSEGQEFTDRDRTSCWRLRACRGHASAKEGFQGGLISRSETRRRAASRLCFRTLRTRQRFLPTEPRLRSSHTTHTMNRFSRTVPLALRAASRQPTMATTLPPTAWQAEPSTSRFPTSFVRSIAAPFSTSASPFASEAPRSPFEATYAEAAVRTLAVCTTGLKALELTQSIVQHCTTDFTPTPRL